MLSSSTFRFKQFSVTQNSLVTKITTDGVLVGAWTEGNSTATNILDIGTGTGVLALIMAQKFSHAKIDAIDIDENAAKLAAQNFTNSPWKDRLTAYCTSLQNFRPPGTYDVIISNPPYFIDDMKSGKVRKDTARHTIALSYEDLLAGIARLLHATGRAMLVLPAFNFEVLQSLAESQNLFVARHTSVISVEGTKPYLALVELRKTKGTAIETALVIQSQKGVFTDAYKALCSDLYLAF